MAFSLTADFGGKEEHMSQSFMPLREFPLMEFFYISDTFDTTAFHSRVLMIKFDSLRKGLATCRYVDQCLVAPYQPLWLVI